MKNFNYGQKIGGRGKNKESHELGQQSDDPNLQTHYPTIELAASSIKKFYYGSTSDQWPIKKNKKEIGYKKIFYCDNKNTEGINCQKAVRVTHVYTERVGADQQIAFKIDIIGGRHSENCNHEEM